ncbi:uracil-DNA glycosylase family protein [Geminicoccus roseus]|uniref:uracil-DNA glycosylase family protein n=1 Tax=Geminicoccus roseus TaxID=404900 RepID=UPI0004279A68|nr:uracil-DNA glycosylase family protein [Geminicoccus roseus]
MRPHPQASDPLTPVRPRPATDLDSLLAEIRTCRRCETRLPHPPRPVLTPKASARILIVGQAPGSRVHASGLPWDDPSGDRLRAWLGVDRTRFYADPAIAVMPMGFCYPGKGRSGDLPPQRECAPAWHDRLLRLMPGLRLVLLVGAYAQRRYLQARSGLTRTVRDWREAPPPFFPLPHPSPRNIGWFQANPWFADQVVPDLRARASHLLAPEPA